MKYIITGILLLCIFIYVNIHYREDYKINGIVYDKSMTSSRGGDEVYYHILIKYDNGETDDLLGVENYTYYEKGVKYTFTKSRLNFSK